MNDQESGTPPTPSAHSIDPESARTEGPDLYSPWAASSLVLMLLSFGGCLVTLVVTFAVNSAAGIALFALPVVSLLGAITGVTGLIQSSRSAGRIGGRGVATFSAIVCLMLLALQSSFVLGALIPWYSTANNVKPVMQRFADRAAAQEPEQLRELLSPATSNALSDAELSAFWARATPGPALGTPPECSVDLSIFVRARQLMSNATLAESADTIDERMFAVRYEWADGTDSLAYAFLDEEALAGNSVMITDILVVNSAGEAATLLPDGPAKKTAEMVGWAVVE